TTASCRPEACHEGAAVSSAIACSPISRGDEEIISHPCFALWRSGLTAAVSPLAYFPGIGSATAERELALHRLDHCSLRARASRGSPSTSRESRGASMPGPRLEGAAAPFEVPRLSATIERGFC